MEKLDSYDFESAPARRSGSRYDQLLDGGIYRLKLGTDCPAHLTNARVVLYTRAKEIGRKVRTRKDGDDHIVIQGFTP